MSNRPTIISIMSSIVYCGAKLGNLLTGIDLNNLGIFSRSQHQFGFRDQSINQNQISTARLFSMQNNQPTPIIRFEGLQQQYPTLASFNTALQDTYEQLRQMPLNVMIDSVASSIVVNNTGTLAFRQPSQVVFRSLICLASWMLTGISPIATNTAISLLGPLATNILTTSILRISSLIEPYRNMRLCQAMTTVFEKISSIANRILPQSFLQIFGSNNQQPELEIEGNQDENLPNQDLPIQISSYQHAQYYINMFDQEINQIQQLVDLLLKMQIQSSISLQTQRRPDQNFYNSSFSQILRDGTLQEKIKMIIEQFSKYLSLLLLIQSSMNRFNLDFPRLENQISNNQNSISLLKNDIKDIKKALDLFDQKLNQLKQRIEIVNQFPPTQQQDINNLIQLLQEQLQSQINQLSDKFQNLVNQLAKEVNDQFGLIQQQLSNQDQTISEVNSQWIQFKQKLIEQIKQFNVDRINDTITRVVNQSIIGLQSQINIIHKTINDIDFFFSEKFLENKKLIQQCSSQHDTLVTWINDNMYNRSQIDELDKITSQNTFNLVFQEMPNFLQNKYQLQPEDIISIKDQLRQIPSQSQVTNEQFNQFKQQVERFQQTTQLTLNRQTNQIDAHNQAVADLNQSINRSNEVIQQQQQTITQLQGQLNEYEENNRQTQQQLDEIIHDQQQHNGQIQQIQDQVSLLQTAQNQIETQYLQLSNKTTDLQGQLIVLRRQQQDYTNQLEQLEERINQQLLLKVNTSALENALLNLITKDQFEIQETRINLIDNLTQINIGKIQSIEEGALQLRNILQQLQDQVITQILFKEYKQQVKNQFIDQQTEIQQLQNTCQEIDIFQQELILLKEQLNHIQQDYDPIQIYNLKSQLQSLKEISYKRFDQLDYVMNISQVNRILDFNHSAAIKSY